MRLLLMLGIVAAAVSAGRSAAAQNYPWCAYYGAGFEGTNCGFTTFEQCMATVSGIGDFCDRNNWYKPPVAAAPPPYRGHKRHGRQP
jgi:hypothetical protein